MFRMGGAAEGITSGLDQPRKQYQNGDKVESALETTRKAQEAINRLKGQQSPLMPGGRS